MKVDGARGTFSPVLRRYRKNCRGVKSADSRCFLGWFRKGVVNLQGAGVLMPSRLPRKGPCEHNPLEFTTSLVGGTQANTQDSTFHGATMPADRYKAIVERFRAWASSEPMVRGALIVGSQARNVAPADEWSDLDVILFVADPPKFLDSPEWVERFGTVLLTTVEKTGVEEGRERRVVYAGGQDVDFSIFPSTVQEFVGWSPDAMQVLQRGFEVLLDKDGHLAKLRGQMDEVGELPHLPPTPPEFEACVGDFWYHVLWAAKKLRRGEVWTAKMVCDSYLKRLLLQMVEWSTLLSGKGETDVWHDGRFLDTWAPPEVKEQLPSVFARYDRTDIARALESTGRVFAGQSHKVATLLGVGYPDAMEFAITELVAKTLQSTPTD